MPTCFIFKTPPFSSWNPQAGAAISPNYIYGLWIYVILTVSTHTHKTSLPCGPLTFPKWQWIVGWQQVKSPPHCPLYTRYMNSLSIHWMIWNALQFYTICSYEILYFKDNTWDFFCKCFVFYVMCDRFVVFSSSSLLNYPCETTKYYHDIFVKSIYILTLNLEKGDI